MCMSIVYHANEIYNAQHNADSAGMVHRLILFSWDICFYFNWIIISNIVIGIHVHKMYVYAHHSVWSECRVWMTCMLRYF